MVERKDPSRFVVIGGSEGSRNGRKRLRPPALPSKTFVSAAALARTDAGFWNPPTTASGAPGAGSSATPAPKRKPHSEC